MGLRPRNLSTSKRDSGNVDDSLAEAYMERGDREPAISNYERSLEIDPDSDNAVVQLEILKGGDDRKT
jgi:tetratricopeptide (TPR) repeat protein